MSLLDGIWVWSPGILTIAKPWSCTNHLLSPWTTTDEDSFSPSQIASLGNIVVDEFPYPHRNLSQEFIDALETIQHHSSWILSESPRVVPIDAYPPSLSSSTPRRLDATPRSTCHVCEVNEHGEPEACMYDDPPSCLQCRRRRIAARYCQTGLGRMYGAN